MKENEDDVQQTLNCIIYQQLFQGASNAGIFVAMWQHFHGPDTVKVVILEVVT